MCGLRGWPTQRSEFGVTAQRTPTVAGSYLAAEF